MLIAVVSDTHRMSKYIKLAKEAVKKADILIHLGDNIEDVEVLEQGFNGKVYAVAGNCDYSSKYPKEGIIEVNGKKIFFTHGDLYGVKSSINNIYYRGKGARSRYSFIWAHTSTNSRERAGNDTNESW